MDVERHSRCRKRAFTIAIVRRRDANRGLCRSRSNPEVRRFLADNATQSRSSPAHQRSRAQFDLDPLKLSSTVAEAVDPSGNVGREAHAGKCRRERCDLEAAQPNGPGELETDSFARNGKAKNDLLA
jgi:hypothetical protein